MRLRLSTHMLSRMCLQAADSLYSWDPSSEHCVTGSVEDGKCVCAHVCILIGVDIFWKVWCAFVSQ